MLIIPLTVYRLLTILLLLGLNIRRFLSRNRPSLPPRTPTFSRPANIHVPPNPYSVLAKGRVSSSGYNTPVAAHSPRMPRSPNPNTPNAFNANSAVRRNYRSVPSTPMLSPRSLGMTDLEHGEGATNGNGSISPFFSFSNYNSPRHSPPPLEEELPTTYPSSRSLHPSASETSIGLGISTPIINNHYPFSSPTAPILPSSAGSRPGQARRVSRMEEKESEIASKHALSAPPTFMRRVRNVSVWRWFSLTAWLGEGLAAKWLGDCFNVFWPAAVCFAIINLTYSWY